MNGQGAHWICTNRNCGWSLDNAYVNEQNGFPPCICGSPMRRSLSSPAFTYLDFLRSADEREAQAEVERKLEQRCEP
jgi:hypothetical protein